MTKKINKKQEKYKKVAIIRYFFLVNFGKTYCKLLIFMVL